MNDGMHKRNGMAIANSVAVILSIAFSAWAGVVLWTANVVINKLEMLEAQVGEGILPRADERITNLERRFERHLDREDHRLGRK